MNAVKIFLEKYWLYLFIAGFIIEVMLTRGRHNSSLFADVIKTQDLTLSAVKLGFYGGQSFLIGTPLLFCPYQFFWGINPGKHVSSVLAGMMWFIAAMFAGDIVHELIHGPTAV